MILIVICNLDRLVSERNAITRTREESEKLLSLLSSVASNELVTHNVYSRLQQSHLVSEYGGFDHQLQDIMKEDQEHYRDVMKTIERLNGDASSLNHQNHVIELMTHRQTIAELLKILCRIEASSVNAYSDICQLTLENDFRTFDIAYRNLYANIAHHNAAAKLLMSIPKELLDTYIDINDQHLLLSQKEHSVSPYLSGTI